MRGWLAVIAVAAGCRFDPGGSPGDAGEIRADAAAPADTAPPLTFCDPTAAELRACYRFEGDGDDASMYGNHAAAAAVDYDEGVDGRGTALRLGAASDVRIGEDPSLDVPGPLTVELWLRVDEAPAQNGRTTALDQNGQWGLFLSPALQVRCIMGSTAEIELQLVLGEWSHVACVYDRETITLYQDGVAAPTPVALTAELPTAPIDGLRIGENGPTGDDQLIGAIDDVRIWSTARSPLQICEAAGCEN